MYEGRDDAARTRPNISVAPTRFDSARAPSFSPSEQLRIFDGTRILIATTVPEAIERLRLSLRELGAQVLVHHPVEDTLAAAGPLDPQVVLLDRESLRGRSTQFFQKLHRDPRLRWASVVRVNASELTQVQVGTLEVLASRLKAKLVPDAKLTGLARQDRTFLLRLSRLGPNRVLRGLDDVSGAVRITTTAQRTLCRLDVQGGMVLGAHYKAVGQAQSLGGLQALAAFLAQEEGELRIERRDRLTLRDINLPIAEAIGAACKKLSSIDEALGHSALLEANSRNPSFSATARYQRADFEAEELDDASIVFVPYQEEEHTQRVHNPTAVLGPSRSEPPAAQSEAPAAQSTPPPIPSAPPVSASVSPVPPSTTPVPASPAPPAPRGARPPATLPPRLAHKPERASSSSPRLALLPTEARIASAPLPRLNVPSSAKERPASSSTIKVRVAQNPRPQKRSEPIRFVAFAAACIALGFVMTTAIRALLVKEVAHWPASSSQLAETQTTQPGSAAPFVAQAAVSAPLAAITSSEVAQVSEKSLTAQAPAGPQPSKASQATRTAASKPGTTRVPKTETKPGTQPGLDTLSGLAEAAAASSAPNEPTEFVPSESRSADYRRADRLIAAGNIEQAIEEMSILLESDLRDHRAMAMIASANLKAGQTTEAIRWAKKAVDVRPTEPSYQNLLGDSLGLMGEREQALVHWDEAKRLRTEQDE